MYLLDTSVLSHLAPTRRQTEADKAFAEWILSHSDELWLSVITAAEIEDGIAKARRTGATRKAADLAEWWGEVRHYHGNRILTLDLATATETGAFIDAARAAGISPGFEDLAIAATAKVNDFTVLTANLKDFEPLGIKVFDPFQALPD